MATAAHADSNAHNASRGLVAEHWSLRRRLVGGGRPDSTALHVGPFLTVGYALIALQITAPARDAGANVGLVLTLKWPIFAVDAVAIPTWLGL